MIGEANPTATEMGIPEKNEQIQDDSIRESLRYTLKTGELNSPFLKFRQIIESAIDDPKIEDEIEHFLMYEFIEDPEMHQKALDLRDDIHQDLQELRENERRAA